jgi:type II secretory pathway pseudopilin PulG
MQKFFLKNYLNNGFQGFTLVEVLVSLAIIMTGIFGAYSLVNQSLALANNASMRLAAVYLAREGIEIVRNIRDTNYLKIYNDTGSSGYEWTDGLAGCAGVNGCRAAYNDSLLTDNGVGVPFLLIAGSGSDKRYNYSSGTATPYKRMIKIVSAGDYLRASVTVEWNRQNSVQSVTVQEDFYNWWGF